MRDGGSTGEGDITVARERPADLVPREPADRRDLFAVSLRRCVVESLPPGSRP